MPTNTGFKTANGTPLKTKDPALLAHLDALAMKGIKFVCRGGGPHYGQATIYDLGNGRFEVLWFQARPGSLSETAVFTDADSEKRAAARIVAKRQWLEEEQESRDLTDAEQDWLDDHLAAEQS